MKAFFKMQLKIYFRLISSYLAPLVIGAFYIILIALIRISIGLKDGLKLVNSNSYVELSSNITIMAAFILCSFVTQTFFYRYRREGIEYILYSKPIKRSEIFFSNVLSSIIGSLMSILIIGICYFLSLLIINFNPKNAILATLSFSWAGMLACIFGLGIAAVSQNFVESKVFQVVVGIIPIFGVFVLNFIKVSHSLNVVKSIDTMESKPVLLIPNKSSIDAKTSVAVKNLNKRISSLNDLLIENESIASIFENNNQLRFRIEDNKLTNKKIDSTIDVINRTKTSIYSKLYWANFKEYFFPLFTAYDKNLQNYNVAIDYNNKRFSNLINKENGSLNKEAFSNLNKKYELDLSKYILIKTTNNDLFSLGYNISNFKNIFNSSIFKTRTWTRLDAFTNDLQNQNYDEFNKFNTEVIDKILNNETAKQVNKAIEFFNLNEYLAKKEVDIVHIYKIINIFSSLTKFILLDDKSEFEKFKNDIDKKLKKEENAELKEIYTKVASKLSLFELLLKTPSLIPKDIKQKLDQIKLYIDKYFEESMKFKGLNLTEIQKARLNYEIAIAKKVVLKSFISLFWNINIFKLISIKEDLSFSSTLNLNNLVSYLSANEENFMNYIKEYKQNTLKLIKLNNNLIEFKRYNYIPPLVGNLCILIISATLILIGFLYFRRKNFK